MLYRLPESERVCSGICNYISFVHYVERKGNASVLYNMPIMEYQEESKKATQS